MSIAFTIIVVHVFHVLCGTRTKFGATTDASLELGVTSFQMGDLKTAADQLAHALQQDPDNAEAYYQLGLTLKAQQQYEAAKKVFWEAIQRKRDGAFTEFLACYSEMNEIYAFYNDMGNVAWNNWKQEHPKPGKYEGADEPLQSIQLFLQAIEADVHEPTAYTRLAEIYKHIGDEEAAEEIMESLELVGAVDEKVLFDRANNYFNNKQFEDSRTTFLSAHLHAPKWRASKHMYIFLAKFVCDWTRYHEYFQDLNDWLEETKSLLESLPGVVAPQGHYLAYQVQQFNQEIHEGLVTLNPWTTLSWPIKPVHKKFVAEYYASTLLHVNINNGLTVKTYSDYDRGLIKDEYEYTGRRLRVGYIGSEFRRKAGGILLFDVIGQHDADKIEVFLYSPSVKDGSLLQRKFFALEHWVDVEDMDIAETLERIRKDKLDILVDVDGYANEGTRRGEVFILRSAPVQINYLAYMGTIGDKNHDYIVTDTVASPMSHENYYTEKFIHLPKTFYPNSHRMYFARPDLSKRGPSTRETWKLPRDAFVYCSFNQFYKLNPDTFTVWMNILREVSNSVLWLLRFANMPAEALERLLKAAEDRGVNANRIIFADWLEDEHLNLERLGLAADVVLDTTIYNSHTSAVDAIYAGVPLITNPQNHMAGRVAASMLTSIEAHSMIAKDMKDYQKIAIRLGTDREFYAETRELFEQAHTQTLFDSAEHCKMLEAGYFKAWNNFLEGNSPTHLTVSRLGEEEIFEGDLADDGSDGDTFGQPASMVDFGVDNVFDDQIYGYAESFDSDEEEIDDTDSIELDFYGNTIK